MLHMKKKNDDHENNLGQQAQLVELVRECENLGQGLRQMMETQENHTKLLRAMLDAATLPADSEGDLQDVLRLIVAAIEQQTTVLEKVEKRLIEGLSSVA